MISSATSPTVPSRGWRRVVSAPGFTAGAQGWPPRISPGVKGSLAMVSMPPEPRHGT